MPQNTTYCLLNCIIMALMALLSFDGSIVTAQPSSSPSSQPTNPTVQPSEQPSSEPSSQPSYHPIINPSSTPSAQPFTRPSTEPTILPTTHPSTHPSRQPSKQPTMQPSQQPFMMPSSMPSSLPTLHPSHPSSPPSMQPSSLPSIEPSVGPSSQPYSQPSSRPSSKPSNEPSNQPTIQPFSLPSGPPSSQPSRRPSLQPFSQHSFLPSAQPSSCPTLKPTRQPTTLPTFQPSSLPTTQPSSQPTTYPSYLSEVVKYPYSVDNNNGYYVVPYNFTNLGMSRHTTFYLTVDILLSGYNGFEYFETQVYNKSKDKWFNLPDVYSNTSSYSMSETPPNESRCYPPEYKTSKKTSNCGQYYRCFTNIEVTKFIQSPSGGDLFVRSFNPTASEPIKLQCPNNQGKVTFKYTISIGTPQPTFLPTVQPTVNDAQSANSFNIKVDGNAALYTIFLTIVLYASLAVILSRIRDTKFDLLTVVQLPFMATVIRFALLGMNISSEIALVCNLFEHKSNKYNNLALLILAARVLQFPMCCYVIYYLIPRHYNKLMVRSHSVEYSYQYGLLYILSHFQLPMLNYLPWKKTYFSSRNGGFPDLFLFNMVNYYELAEYAVSVACQLIYTTTLSFEDSLEIDNLYVYFSVASSLLLILIFIFELYSRIHFAKEDHAVVRQINRNSKTNGVELGKVENGHFVHGVAYTQYQNMSREELEREIDICLQRRFNKSDSSDSNAEKLDLLIDIMHEKISKSKTVEQLRTDSEMREFAEKAYSRMLIIVPSSIFNLSLSDLFSRGFSKDLSKRLHSKRCLWLLRVHPSILKYLLTEESIRTVYEVTSETGLDIIELGALCYLCNQAYLDIQSKDGKEETANAIGTAAGISASSQNPMLQGSSSGGGGGGVGGGGGEYTAFMMWKGSIATLFEKKFDLFQNGDLPEKQLRDPDYYDVDERGDMTSDYKAGSGGGGLDNMSLLRLEDISVNSSKPEMEDKLNELQGRLERKEKDFEKEVQSRNEDKLKLEEKNRVLASRVQELEADMQSFKEYMRKASSK